MSRLFIFLVSCAVFTPALAPAQTTPRIERDIAYAQPKNERQLLDVYAPPTGSNLPVVVWVHGGGWMRGGKNEVDQKPTAFVERGFVFVPVNYRFVPVVTMDMIVRDVAKAVGWVHANITRHGGDPNRVFLMGHSAGAQLAVLLCTDSRYIEAEAVPRTSIKGCVPSTATPTTCRCRSPQGPPATGALCAVAENGPHRAARAAVNHVAPNRGIPPILHVADHTDTAAQAYRLAALDQAGIPAKLFGPMEQIT